MSESVQVGDTVWVDTLAQQGEVVRIQPKSVSEADDENRAQDKIYSYTIEMADGSTVQLYDGFHPVSEA